jgi:hypothetical protein
LSPGTAPLTYQRNLFFAFKIARVQVRDGVASGALVELLFYTSHRLLHTKYLYPYHKLHHGYKAPIALAALYAHPLEAVLGNTLAVMAPAYICGIHGYSWLWGVALGFASTQAKHSGFDIDGAGHDRHHQFSNVEYGHLGVMDFMSACVLQRFSFALSHPHPPVAGRGIALHALHDPAAQCARKHHALAVVHAFHKLTQARILHHVIYSLIQLVAHILSLSQVDHPLRTRSHHFTCQ